MALTTTDNSRFFGIDWRQWPRQWQAAGALLFGLPGLRWLAPAVRVQLRHADGRLIDYSVSHGIAVPIPRQQPGTAVAHAVELPPSRVLERSLMLPPLAPADLVQAVQLEVASASPFDSAQTVCGHAAQSRDGVCQVDIAMTSRQQVEQTLREAAASVSQPPEVWVLPGAAAATSAGAALRPVVLQGFGEPLRQRAVQRGLALRLALLVLALALLGALAVTPTALLRLRSQQATRAFDAIQRQAAPQIARREALMQRVERLHTIGQMMDSQITLGPVLNMLTRTIPDGAWVTQLRLEDGKLVLNGSADDAAALVQGLAAQPGVRDVRLASPATRAYGANKETFIIEMNLDAKHYGLIRNAGAPS
ncbi:MAG: PilN domain-containing protein [Burkholderiaceae bacterium]|jgi:general secretion pathway protein L|nr:PilN domain-containing protein [Burkholderiaceae bacterium]